MSSSSTYLNICANCTFESDLTNSKKFNDTLFIPSPANSYNSITVYQAFYDIFPNVKNWSNLKKSKDLKLCWNCCFLLSSLWKAYKEFLELSHVNSKIYQIIHHHKVQKDSNNDLFLMHEVDGQEEKYTTSHQYEEEEFITASPLNDNYNNVDQEEEDQNFSIEQIKTEPIYSDSKVEEYEKSETESIGYNIEMDPNEKVQENTTYPAPIPIIPIIKQEDCSLFEDSEDLNIDGLKVVDSYSIPQFEDQEDQDPLNLPEKTTNALNGRKARSCKRKVNYRTLNDPEINDPDFILNSSASENSEYSENENSDTEKNEKAVKMKKIKTTNGNSYNNTPTNSINKSKQIKLQLKSGFEMNKKLNNIILNVLAKSQQKKTKTQRDLCWTLSCRAPNCDKHFNSQIEINNHLKEEAKARPYSCSKCGWLFKHKIRLELHEQTQSHLKKSCLYCKKYFASKNAQDEHFNKFHKVTSLNKSQFGFWCCICKIVYKEIKTLAMHFSTQIHSTNMKNTNNFAKTTSQTNPTLSIRRTSSTTSTSILKSHEDVAKTYFPENNNEITIKRIIIPPSSQLPSPSHLQSQTEDNSTTIEIIKKSKSIPGLVPL